MNMSTEDKLRRALEAAKMARTRLDRFADEANAGRVHYDARELKRKIGAAFTDFDEALAATQEQRGELKGFNRMSNARMEVKVRDYKDRLATEIGSAIEARILTGSEDIFGIGREVVAGKFVSSLIESALRSAPSAHTSSKSDAQTEKPK